VGPRQTIGLLLALIGCSALLLLACGADDDGPEGDIEGYCQARFTAWCPVYYDCDPFGFQTGFRSLEECIEHSVRDCLDPPPGTSRCEGATAEETEACVTYIQSNSGDGCRNLFGITSDLSPCEEDICD